MDLPLYTSISGISTFVGPTLIPEFSITIDMGLIFLISLGSSGIDL